MREKLYNLLQTGKISEEEYHQLMNLKFDNRGRAIELTEEDEKLYDNIEKLVSKLTRL